VHPDTLSLLGRFVESTSVFIPLVEPWINHGDAFSVVVKRNHAIIKLDGGPIFAMGYKFSAGGCVPPDYIMWRCSRIASTLKALNDSLNGGGDCGYGGGGGELGHRISTGFSG
jgi:hypothetical protein